ncbi:MAG: serine protease-like protein [Archaeoglobus sp.]|uniref:S16 family serine protease n=1 Tax=Archaeoglobus sp. TaxID=1872626 RepID=UPI001DEE54AE|nr:S16 family serine protease [Archaeoglobus sp.]MBO8179662.1 serine protease-like protein [Archaeoglobus sp.]
MRSAIIFLILMLVLITPAGAQFENAQKASIKAVAVTSGDQPTGVVINISVIVTPGDGRVFVSTTPYTEIDMQGSAQLAAITACDLLGIDFTKYDFFYTIEAEAPIVGGPSAGGVMTVATIAALKNLSIRDDVYMTGMIYPDGYIGPVGGLKYKLEAAAKNGAKIFLIPQGQRITYVEEKKVRRVGIISYIEVEYQELDLVEYGKQIGVNVYEVATINDALKFFTGFEIKHPEGQFNIGSYSTILKKLADRMKSSLDEISATNDDAEKLIEKANQYYNEGKYYTATSTYFQAKILKRYEEYRNKIITAQQFDEEVEKIQNEIDQMKNYLSEESVGVNSLQIIAAAQERVAEAENLLEDAKNARTDDEALQNLAYAKERVESAKVWLSILPDLKNDYEVSPEVLKRRAEFYVTEASSLLIYASSLNGNEYLINEGFDSLETAKRLLSEGLYAGAAFMALNSITDASLSIEVTYGKIDDKVQGAREAAMVAISEAEKSLFPVLPAAYFEYAENLDNPYVKLMYYKLSMRLAKLLSLMVSSGGVKELVHAEFNPYTYSTPSSGKSTIERVIETPGFEGLAAAISITVAAIAVRRR